MAPPLSPTPSVCPLPLPQELLATEGVALSFTEGAVRALASLAEQVGPAVWGAGGPSVMGLGFWWRRTDEAAAGGCEQRLRELSVHKAADGVWAQAGDGARAHTEQMAIQLSGGPLGPRGARQGFDVSESVWTAGPALAHRQPPIAACHMSRPRLLCHTPPGQPPTCVAHTRSITHATRPIACWTTLAPGSQWLSNPPVTDACIAYHCTASYHTPPGQSPAGQHWRPAAAHGAGAGAGRH